MLRFAVAALALGVGLALSAPPASATENMDRCVFFSWAHVSSAPSTFEYRLTNYCKRRIYVQVCVQGTRVCRGHHLGRAPRLISRSVQEPTKRGERMTFRAVAN